MGALKLSSFPRNYQFQPAALSALTLPQVSSAMREAVSGAFDAEFAHLVDHSRHSAFCLDAYEGGFIGDQELDWLTAFPNAYGLHQVTQHVVEAIESSISFKKSRLIPGVKRRMQILATPVYELQPAAQTTVACIEAGLFTADSVQSLVDLGPDCAYHLMKRVESSLVDLVSADAPEVKEWLSVEMQGESLSLSPSYANRFELALPYEVREDFREVEVFLFKALDAMTTYLVHFHTPSTFMGVYSYDAHGVADAYGEIKDRVATSTFEELVRYLMETPAAELPFESWHWDFENDEPDEGCAEHFASLLMEMHQLTSRTHFILSTGEDAKHDIEIQELIDQVQDSINAGSPYSAVLEVIKDAFEVCLTYAKTGDRAIGERELEGSAEDGVGVFEAILVLVKDQFQMLEEEACSSFDDRANCVGDICLMLPLEASVLPLQTIPILSKTKQCISLLTRITQTIEGCDHAQ